MLTSICRSIVTICSGLYLCIGMTSFSSKWILSHSTWYKNPRSGQQLQQRSEESVQRCCHLCQHASWPPARFLCCSDCPRDAADDGTSYPGAKNGCNHFNDVEERSGFRSPTVASASRLSLSGEEGFPSQDFLRWWSLRFGELGSRVSISQ